MILYCFSIIFFICWLSGLILLDQMKAVPSSFKDSKAFLPTKNSFEFLVYSLSIGTFSFFILLLSLTHLGFKLSFSAGLLSSLFFSLLIYKVFFLKQDLFTTNSSSDKKNFYLPALLIIFYAGYLILIKSIFYFPSWDHFTYWLVDAKEIFIHDHLRTTAEINNYFNYTSFLPLQFSLLYQLLGSIKEEATGIFSVIYLSLSSMLVLSVNKVQTFKTNFILSLLCILIFSCFWNLSVVSYAEAFTAFCFTLFFRFLINDSPQFDVAKKITFLISLLIGIGFIKGPFKIYSIFLLLFLIVYYAREIKKIKKKSFIYLLIPVLILISQLYYRLYVWREHIEIPLVDERRLLLGTISERLQYILDTFAFLFKNHPVMSVLYLFVILYALMKIKNWKQNSKSSIALISALILFPGINIGYYILEMTSHQSQSLSRYVTPTFFVLGLFFANEFSQKISSWGKKTTIFVTLILSLLIHKEVLRTHHHIKNFDFHDWKASSNKTLEPMSSAALKAATLLPQNARLLFVGDIDTSISNMGFSSLIQRYLLLPNSVGGLYRVPIDKFSDKLFTAKPDFLYLTDFTQDGPTLKFLNLNLSNEHSYLVKIESFSPLKLGAITELN